MVPIRNQSTFGAALSRSVEFECANYHRMELAKECVGRVVYHIAALIMIITGSDHYDRTVCPSSGFPAMF